MSRRTSPAPVPPPVSVAEAMAAADLVDGQAAAAAAAGRLPVEARALVRDITTIGRRLLPRLAGGTGSSDVHLVTAAITSYLPTALAHFTRLPAEWAATVQVAPGRTSLDVLVGQLTALADGLAALDEQVCRADAAALLAHEAFIADRFDGSITLGSLSLPVFGSQPPPVSTVPAAPAGPEGVEPRVPRPRRPGDAPRVALTVAAVGLVAVACALPSSLTAAGLDPHPHTTPTVQASAAAADLGPGLVGPVVADGGAR